MKKIIFYISLIFLLFSCDGQIAKNQFERGEYRKSVKTTVSYISNGKFSKLKLDEKEELIRRMEIIDNFYSKNINNSNNISNVKNMYDAFAITYMLESVPELNTRLRYLNSSRTDNLILNVKKTIENNINYYSKNELESIREIQYDMRSLGLLNSRYYNVYKSISKSLADRYLSLSRSSRSIEEEINYLYLTADAYQDFENDYQNSKTRAKALEKKLKISKAYELYKKGKDSYYLNNFNEAYEYFKEAYEIYSEYSDYNYIAREVKVFLENSEVKAKEELAEKYLQKAYYYAGRGDYSTAIQYFYKAHSIIENYKGSYRLAKEFEQKQSQKISFNLRTNSDRGYLIRKVLVSEGLVEKSYNPNVELIYTENIDYNIQNLDNVGYKYRETITIKTRIEGNNRYLSSKTRTYIKEGYYDTSRPYGKYNMIKMYESTINNELEKEIRSIARRFSNR